MKHSCAHVEAAKPASDFPETSLTSPGSAERVESTGCAAQRSTRGISSRARRLPDDFPVYDFPVGDRGHGKLRRKKRTSRQKAVHLRDTQTNKTGFLGVKHRQNRGDFVAYIRDHRTKAGAKVYCGCGKTAEDAARAYDRKAWEIYGAGAVTNFQEQPR